ncbi:hypothetical protein D3C75_863560 [compost metagenome]
MLEVHPVDAGQCGREGEDRRPGGELALHHALSRGLQQQAELDGVVGHFALSGEVFLQAADVNGDVAEVRAHRLVDEREVELLKLAANLRQRRDLPAQA